MIVCRKGKPEEYEDIIDFANYVFSQNERPHDFKKLLPKLYADHRDYAQKHYLVLEDEKIKAVVCAVPLELLTPETVLKTCCIGTVSVHPYSRGKGYMKKLMSFMMEDMQKQGCAYLFLGGQRQRYEYFGFEPAGIQLDFTVTGTNVRHCLHDINPSALKLVPLTQEVLLDKAYSLYEAQPYRIRRGRKDFYEILCSWQSRPYAAILDGNFAGSLVLRPDGTVTELLVNDASALPYVVKALFSMTGRDMHLFLAAPAETDKIDFLMHLAESWRTAACENYRIFDWCAVIKAFLYQKAGLGALPEGSLILRIEDITVKLTVGDNVASVQESTEEADFSLSALDAAAYLFSPAGEFMLNKYGVKLSAAKRACIRGWFPLPLTSMQNDCC